MIPCLFLFNYFASKPLGNKIERADRRGPNSAKLPVACFVMDKETGMGNNQRHPRVAAETPS